MSVWLFVQGYFLQKYTFWQEAKTEVIFVEIYIPCLISQMVDIEAIKGSQLDEQKSYLSPSSMSGAQTKRTFESSEEAYKSKSVLSVSRKCSPAHP